MFVILCLPYSRLILPPRNIRPITCNHGEGGLLDAWVSLMGTTSRLIHQSLLMYATFFPQLLFDTHNVGISETLSLYLPLYTHSVTENAPPLLALPPDVDPT